MNVESEFLERNCKPLLFGLFFIWSFYIVTLGAYASASGDEGTYHYPAVLMAQGHLPVLDFFSLQGIWSTIPYAGLIKLFGPHTVSVRLFSVFSLITCAAMITALAWRHFGALAAILTFVFFSTSWHWTLANIEVRHSPPSNLGLLAAFFFGSSTFEVDSERYGQA